MIWLIAIFGLALMLIGSYAAIKHWGNPFIVFAVIIAGTLVLAHGLTAPS